MSQLHTYLPDELADQVRKRAAERGVTVSRYLAELIGREVVTGWPDGFFDEVVGGWVGEPLQRPAQGALEDRKDLR